MGSSDGPSMARGLVPEQLDMKILRAVPNSWQAFLHVLGQPTGQTFWTALGNSGRGWQSSYRPQPRNGAAMHGTEGKGKYKFLNIFRLLTKKALEWDFGCYLQKSNSKVYI